MTHRPQLATIPLAFILLVFSCGAAFAQWSSDPAVNTPIAVKISDQVQPKVKPITGGGWYISWFDNAPGGYDVFLQRLDKKGVKQWAPNGLRIANRNLSSTEDYGLDVDAAGNALLVFGDDRSGSMKITATKVDQAGTQLWGATGKQMPDTSADVHAPKITLTSDGQIAVAWTSVKTVKVRRMDPDGNELWLQTMTPGTGNSLGLADLHASDAGGVIVSFVRTDSSSNRHLLAQKYNSAGTVPAGWPAAGRVVFDGGSLQMGNYPAFVSDGAGGAAFGWYSIALQCYAQHLLADATEAFGHNGSVASTDTSHSRSGPSVQFNPATGETFLFFNERYAGQEGVFGQKFNATGVRQWTNKGLPIRPLAGVTIFDILAVQTGGDNLVFWIDETGYLQDQLFAARVDTLGDYVCSPFLVSSSLTAKSDTDAAIDSGGVTVASWQNGPAGEGDLYAQNINPDCSLGLLAPPLEVSPPGAAQPLVFTDRVTLVWDEKTVSGSDTFNLYRGDTTSLPAQTYGDCLEYGIPNSTTQDPLSPPEGISYFYLVSGRNGGGEGPLGASSQGDPREPETHCP